MALWSYSNIKLGHVGFHLDYIVNISIFSQQFHHDNRSLHASKNSSETENGTTTDSTADSGISDDRIKSNQYLVLLRFPSNVYVDRNELVSFCFIITFHYVTCYILWK